MARPSLMTRFLDLESRINGCRAEIDREALLELEGWLRRHAWRATFFTAAIVLLLALGFYTLGNGKLSILECLSVAFGMTMSVSLVVLTAWARPAAFSNRPVRRILMMVVLATVGGLVGAFFAEPNGWPAFVSNMERVGPSVLFAAGFLGLILAGLATGISMLRSRARLREAQLAQSVAAARIAALQAQVEPHFLFNTLGAIVELAEPGSPAAAGLCRHLVDFLRGSLGSLRAGTSTLGADLDVVRAYLQVMAIRIGPRLTWSVQADDTLRDLPLPPALTISLVENAIKHGIEPFPDAASVRLAASATATTLTITVEDTGAGLSAQRSDGFGLSNIRERLRLQFGDQGRLVVEANRPRGTRAVLHIPRPSAVAS